LSFEHSIDSTSSLGFCVVEPIQCSKDNQQNTTQKPKEEVESIQCSKDNRQNTTQKPKEEVESIQCSKLPFVNTNISSRRVIYGWWRYLFLSQQ
jgi:hypothetical protein